MHLRIARHAILARVAAGQLTDDRWDVRQFHGSFDERMTREDLLDERRSGARHTNDEDRIRCPRAGPRARVQEFRHEQCLRAAHVRFAFGRAVPMLLATYRRTRRVVGEGFLVRRRILECLAERVLEMQAIVVAEISPGECAPDRADVGVREAKGFEVGETPVRLTEGRLKVDGAAVCGDTVVEAPCSFQRVPVAQPDLGLLRVLRQH